MESGEGAGGGDAEGREDKVTQRRVARDGGVSGRGLYTEDE